MEIFEEIIGLTMEASDWEPMHYRKVTMVWKSFFKS